MSLFSRYKNALKAEQLHITSLRIALACITLICGFLAYGWHNAPKNLTIHVPPSLSSGSTKPWWEIPKPNVYSFSFYIFQQLNRWASDGEQDYTKNIERLKPYLTPACYEYLKDDYQHRADKDELRGRSRGVYEIPGRGYADERVETLSNDSWNVTLDLATDEYYLNDPVKRVLVRYPLNVVRFDVDQELNPWGLALNCYFDTPKRIKLAKEETEE